MSVEQLLAEARRRHGDVSLCCACDSWENSIVDGAFWYNDENGSTHLIWIHKLTRED